MRAIILVMDSVGIGSAPDASAYGDAGADTVGHIAQACARGAADSAAREGLLHVPNLARLGLGEACRLASGQVPPGLATRQMEGRYGCAAEVSKGKDTPSGHWELAGVPVPFDWGYFPRTVPCFPKDVVAQLCERAALPGILGNCHASGTEIISQLGDEHTLSGKPICYTSADSVFQVAAHEQEFGLERLYTVCEIHSISAASSPGRFVDLIRIMSGRIIAAIIRSHLRPIRSSILRPPHAVTSSPSARSTTSLHIVEPDVS